jgi:hypothetical protein
MEGLQLWRVAMNTLNKQPQTNDKGWSSSLGLGVGLRLLLKLQPIHSAKRCLLTSSNSGSGGRNMQQVRVAVVVAVAAMKVVVVVVLKTTIIKWHQREVYFSQIIVSRSP